MAKKEQMYWQGHPVDDEEHLRKLKVRHADLWLGAGHEGQRLPQHKAEQKVKEEDRQERFAKMAAHHLDGYKACKAVGNHKDAAQHMDHYALHLKRMGHEPVGPVPNEVKKWLDAPDKEHAYNFKAGKDDYLLLENDGHVDIKKAEKGKQACPWCESRKVQESDQEPDLGTHRCQKCGEHFFSDDQHARNSSDATIRARAARRGPPAGDHTALLSYLEDLGFGDATVSPVRAPPRVVASNPNVAPVPSKANLRVVKAEFLPWLAKMSTLAKAQPQPRTPREFSAHKTFLRHRSRRTEQELAGRPNLDTDRGPDEPEERAFDYSSFLEPEQYNSGYRMFVMSHGKNNPVRVHVLHHQMGAGPTWGTKVGGAVGHVEDGDLGINTYFTHHQHQGQGLEPAMLNAMMHHGKAQMGAYSLSHDEFEPDASALIEAVAKPHGLELGDIEDVDVPEPTNRMSPKEGRAGRRPLMVDWDDGR